MSMESTLNYLSRRRKTVIFQFSYYTGQRLAEAIG